MNIDIHHHVLPEGYFDAIKEDGLFGTTRFETDSAGTSWIASIGPAHAGSAYQERYHRSMHDLDEIIADMDAMSLDVAAISPVPPTNPYGMPPETAEKVCEILNRGLSEMARAKPDRLVALASVPLQDGKRAAIVLERAVKELGMRGAEILSHADGRNLDDPLLFPFFEKAAELQVPLFMHPHTGLVTERLDRYYFRNLVGLPTETAIAAGSLIFGAVLDRLPDLVVILAHGGGYFPYQLGRLDHGWAVRDEGKVNLKRQPSEAARQLYFDNLIHNGESLAFLVNRFGSHRVVLGTDHPFDMGCYRPVEEVKELDLPLAAERQICGENLRALLRL
jgi:aminocarboxymuconate-semialdehyde decarboxylase